MYSCVEYSFSEQEPQVSPVEEYLLAICAILISNKFQLIKIKIYLIKIKIIIKIFNIISLYNFMFQTDIYKTK